MHDRLHQAIWEWAAGAALAWLPILSHLLIALASDRPVPVDAWAIDFVVAALTTAGLWVVSLLARLMRGTIILERVPPHCLVILTMNLIAFLASGIIYGEAMTDPHTAGIALPVALLVGVTGCALYFEIMIVTALAEPE